MVAVALASAATSIQADSDSSLLYQLESEVTLPSTNSGWDYIKMEPNSGKLFMARARDGLTVFDVDRSQTTASVPIGEYVDGSGVDERRKRIVTSNIDGTLTVIAQKGPDQYELLGTVSTRPGARMMFMDERNGKLYVVTAAYTIGKPAVQGNLPDEAYHPNTFVVLTYKPV